MTRTQRALLDVLESNPANETTGVPFADILEAWYGTPPLMSLLKSKSQNQHLRWTLQTLIASGDVLEVTRDRFKSIAPPRRSA